MRRLTRAKRLSIAAAVALSALGCSSTKNVEPKTATASCPLPRKDPPASAGSLAGERGEGAIEWDLSGGLFKAVQDVLLTGDATINAGGGDITFGGKVDAGFTLTANSTGTTTFSGAVGTIITSFDVWPTELPRIEGRGIHSGPARR